MNRERGGSQALEGKVAFSESLPECGEACVTLRRAGKKNAIDLDMVIGIADQFERWQSDERVSSVRIVSSVPGLFSAGGDLAAFTAGGAGSAAYQVEFLQREYALLAAIRRSRLTTVCEIDGLAMGGGLGLAMACTKRVIRSRALFAMPELAIGLIPDVGASGFLRDLPDSVGLVVALTGYKATAFNAVSWGWGEPASGAEPDGETSNHMRLALKSASDLVGVSEDIFDWFQRLGASSEGFPETTNGVSFAGNASALAASVTWEMMRHDAMNCLPYEARLRIELELVRRLTESGEFVRGITGFLSRRPPDFVYGTVACPKGRHVLKATARAWLDDALEQATRGPFFAIESRR